MGGIFFKIGAQRHNAFRANESIEISVSVDKNPVISKVSLEGIEYQPVDKLLYIFLHFGFPHVNLLALLLTKTEPAKTPGRQVSSHVMPVMSN